MDNYIEEKCMFFFTNNVPCNEFIQPSCSFCANHQSIYNKLHDSCYSCGYYDCDGCKSNYFKKYTKMEKKYVVGCVKDLLAQCENAHGKENKASYASQIYDLLCERRRFIEHHKRFSDTVHSKLLEFADDPDAVALIDVDLYLKILFPSIYNIDNGDNNDNESNSDNNNDSNFDYTIEI